MKDEYWSYGLIILSIFFVVMLAIKGGFVAWAVAILWIRVALLEVWHIYEERIEKALHGGKLKWDYGKE